METITLAAAKRRIERAIRRGKHSTAEIMEAANLDTHYWRVCQAIAEMQRAGRVRYDKVLRGYYIDQSEETASE